MAQGGMKAHRIRIPNCRFKPDSAKFCATALPSSHGWKKGGVNRKEPGVNLCASTSRSLVIDDSRSYWTALTPSPRIMNVGGEEGTVQRCSSGAGKLGNYDRDSSLLHLQVIEHSRWKRGVSEVLDMQDENLGSYSGKCGHRTELLRACRGLLFIWEGGSPK